MKNILKNLLAVLLIATTATTARAVDDSFGFERTKDASSGQFSDFALESSYEKISLNWIESVGSGRIQPLTGVFKYTIDGVEYSTSNGQTAYKYYGVLEEAEWGYVFQECTVKPGTYAEMTPDKSYSLGRPWQNEPRCYFLNTVMEILPTDIGWASMAEIPTHFYEYNSLDKDGNPIDLSVRGNSPSSKNQYTPVLSDEEAADFTAYNVVGGKDGWPPSRYTAQVEAPVVTLQGDTLTWAPVADALCYVIYKDGAYVENTVETTFEIAEMGEGTYTVCATNEMGGQGDVSNAVEYSVVSSIKDVNADNNADEAIYDLMGRRLQHIDKPGIYIVGGKKVIYTD